MRRGQQPVHHFFVGIRRLVTNKRFHFGRSGRQSDEIECNAANQVNAIRGLRRGQFVGLEYAQDKCVDGRSHPRSRDFGHWGPDDFLKSPVLSTRADELRFFVGSRLVRGERGRESHP